MSNKTILVVDDSAIFLRTVKNMLSSYYDVEMALSADAAMAAISEKKPDLILLDYDMPICNGKGMLQRLRHRNDTKDIPVIFLTAIDKAEQVKEILLMQPQGYLLKPVDPNKLLSTVDNVLWT